LFLNWIHSGTASTVAEGGILQTPEADEAVLSALSLVQYPTQFWSVDLN
jgi:hypothetical protein